MGFEVRTIGNMEERNPSVLSSALQSLRHAKAGPCVQFRCCFASKKGPGRGLLKKAFSLQPAGPREEQHETKHSSPTRGIYCGAAQWFKIIIRITRGSRIATQYLSYTHTKKMLLKETTHQPNKQKQTHI